MHIPPMRASVVTDEDGCKFQRLCYGLLDVRTRDFLGADPFDIDMGIAGKQDTYRASTGKYETTFAA